MMKAIEQANEAKSIFISAGNLPPLVTLFVNSSTVSHELRSPLNAIFGFAQLLSELTLTNEQHDYVDSIISAAEGLIQLVC